MLIFITMKLNFGMYSCSKMWCFSFLNNFISLSSTSTFHAFKDGLEYCTSFKIFSFIVNLVTLYHFSLHFAFSKVSHIPSLLSFKSMASVFINCCYMHLCKYICIYIHFPKCSWLSLQNVTCIYVFRAEHLVLGNKLVCSPTERTVSPALSFP